MLRLSFQEYAERNEKIEKLRSVGNIGTNILKDKEEVIEFKPNKFGAVKVDTSEGRFDSKLEKRVWDMLKLRQAAGEIKELRHHVKFSMFGQFFEHIGVYEADFVYFEHRKEHGNWARVVADAKSTHTRKMAAWARTKKLFLSCTGVAITELP